MITQSENGKFVLYVSNQSNAIDPVNINIRIDDTLAIEQNFEWKGGHNWKQFKFDLANGMHNIRAESQNGNASLGKDINIQDSLWVVVNYWYYPEQTGGAGPTPRKFTIDVYETQPAFD